MVLAVSGLVIFAVAAFFWHRRTRRAGRRRVALVLRLENPDVMRGMLGPVGMAELLAAITRRLSADLAIATPIQTGAVQSGSNGEFRAILGPLSPDELWESTRLIRAVTDDGILLPQGRVLPALSSALILDDAGDTADQQLYAFGRQVLARKGPGAIGHVATLSFTPPDAVTEQPLAPLFSTRWLELRFLPRLCTDTGAIVGAEVEPLLNHPGIGLLESHTFLPRLRDDEQIDTAREILRQALDAVKGWDAAGVGVDTITIPFGENQISHPDLADTVLWELDRQDMPPNRLAIVVSNSAELGQVPGDATDNLARLAAAGCRIEVDEFGLGGASAKILRKFGASTVRISRKFVEDCDHAIEQQRMILAILALGEHFALPTVALDVQSGAERAFLAQIGVARLQGPAISAPIDRIAMDRLLADRGRPAPIPLPLRQVG